MNYVHLRVLACAVILAVLLSGSAQSSSELHVEQIGNRLQAGKGYMETIGPMVFMHLKGAPYEMARISVDSITKYA
jgi:cytochrome c556